MVTNTAATTGLALATDLRELGSAPADLADPVRNCNAILLLRRERAAALWRSVPRGMFDMESWRCGSRACALGWLAREGLDGWSWGPATHLFPKVPIAPSGRRGYGGAADWFGITVAQATACFGGTRETARFHDRFFLSRVTPADVARSLLALPVSPFAVEAELAVCAEADPAAPGDAPPG